MYLNELVDFSVEYSENLQLPIKISQNKNLRSCLTTFKVNNAQKVEKK